jgi:hypothetical protein
MLPSTRGNDQNDDLLNLLSSLLIGTLKKNNSKRFKLHENVVCDSCNSNNIVYNRYKCFICENYDLCSLCFENRIFKQNEKNPHQISHLMVLINEPINYYLTKEEYSKFFEGVSFKKSDLINKYLIEKGINHQEIKCVDCVKKGKDSNILGIRYQCDDCFKMNYCHECYKVKNHQSNHVFVAFLFTEDTSFLKLNELEFKEQLGQGCFGRVVKTFCKKNNKTYACKILEVKDEATLQFMFDSVTSTCFKNTTSIQKNLYSSFINELRAYAEVTSSFLVQFIGFIEEKKNEQCIIYIFLEYMENGSLRTFLDKNLGKVSFRRKFQFLLDIVCGLKRIHQKNMIHRDLRLDNILVDSVQRAKICDLGISFYSESPERLDDTIPIACAPPEFFKKTHKDQISQSIDIYMLGLLINDIFCSYLTRMKDYQLNYRGRPDMKLDYDKSTIKSVYFRKLIDKCMDSNPNARPKTKEIESNLIEFDNFFWKHPSLPQDYYYMDTESKDEIFNKFYKEWENKFK